VDSDSRSIFQIDLKPHGNTVNERQDLVDCSDDNSHQRALSTRTLVGDSGLPTIPTGSISIHCGNILLRHANITQWSQSRRNGLWHDGIERLDRSIKRTWRQHIIPTPTVARLLLCDSDGFFLDIATRIITSRLRRYPHRSCMLVVSHSFLWFFASLVYKNCFVFALLCLLYGV